VNTEKETFVKLSKQIAAFIGNLLEHYDTALFGLLSPFLAPLFFPNQEPITALIFTYSILPLGLFVRPLGSIIFGWIADHVGCSKALFYSLFGTAITTISIGLLPTYEKVGILAPIFLALGRALQGFFAAGESIGGAIFLLEKAKPSSKSLLSSFYDVTTIGGGLIASLAVSMLCQHSSINYTWRILFLLGGVTALIGLIIRYGQKPQNNLPIKVHTPLSWSFIKQHKKTLISIAIACGFSHITYTFAFSFMNGFIPLITHFSKTEMLQCNTKLLLCDMCLLPCFGYLAHKIGKEKVMLFGAISACIAAYPLFSFLGKDPSLHTLFFIRMTIVVLGTAFAAPYYAWAIELAPTKHRCLILALGANIGSQLLAAPSQSVCLWLYKATKWEAAPAVYFILLGALASFVVLRPAYRLLYSSNR
jgi:MFS family permease